jgi:hypothetical protein
MIAGTVRRVGLRARLWRTGVAVLVLATLLYGSAAGTDDLFPFGPMVQFAFSVPSNGEIRSYWLEADTIAGTRVRVPPGAVGGGLKRAEIEGQMSRLVRDPALLQGIADGFQRLHPDQPRYTKVYVMVEITSLRNGKPAGRRSEVRTAWEVR